ncbi:hypothetical protein C8R46DRAFT_468798 [Mycena filopes]|nr:hypothetical protein C8R46DRAFT_468798 [Mycena filopes]
MLGHHTDPKTAAVFAHPWPFFSALNLVYFLALLLYIFFSSPKLRTLATCAAPRDPTPTPTLANFCPHPEFLCSARAREHVYRLPHHGSELTLTTNASVTSSLRPPSRCHSSSTHLTRRTATVVTMTMTIPAAPSPFSSSDDAAEKTCVAATVPVRLLGSSGVASTNLSSCSGMSWRLVYRARSASTAARKPASVGSVSASVSLIHRQEGRKKGRLEPPNNLHSAASASMSSAEMTTLQNASWTKCWREDRTDKVLRAPQSAAARSVAAQGDSTPTARLYDSLCRTEWNAVSNERARKPADQLIGGGIMHAPLGKVALNA